MCKVGTKNKHIMAAHIPAKAVAGIVSWFAGERLNATTIIEKVMTKDHFQWIIFRVSGQTHCKKLGSYRGDQEMSIGFVKILPFAWNSIFFDRVWTGPSARSFSTVMSQVSAYLKICLKLFEIPSNIHNGSHHPRD